MSEKVERLAAAIVAEQPSWAEHEECNVVPAQVERALDKLGFSLVDASHLTRIAEELEARADGFAVFYSPGARAFREAAQIVRTWGEGS